VTSLSVHTLKALQLPLKACQQLADIRFKQGEYIAINTPSNDLLAGMKVKSRLAAINATQSKPSTFDYHLGLTYLDNFNQDTPSTLTSEYIRQLHHQLNPQGGQWRGVKMVMPRRDNPAQNIEIKLAKDGINQVTEDLLQQLHMALNNHIDPLIVIPLFTYELMKSFPFLDGNWRLLLLLSRHLLITNGHSVAQYIDIESECNATSRTFYRTLYQCQQDNNPQAWLSYWWVLIKRLYLRFERQIQHANIQPGRGAKTALINRFVKQQHSFKFQDVCAAFPTISRDQVRIVLRNLRDQQIIQAKGRGPGAVWVKYSSN
jgi:Fic family protein